MLSGPDLADLIAYAKSRGAKIILAGDTSQLQAVENGGGMSLLAGTLGYARLAEPVRFRAAWEQAASLRLRDGDTTVLAEYDQHARIIGGDPEQMMDAAAAAYVALTAERHRHPADGRRPRAAPRAEPPHPRRPHRPRHRPARPCGDHRRRHQGQPRRPDHLHPQRPPGRGGRARPDPGQRRPAPHRRHHPDGLLVRRALDADPRTGQRRWTARAFRYAGYQDAELGYAVTDHAAQGRTVHTGLAVITGTEDRQHAYVALTRGTDANLAYVFTALPQARRPGARAEAGSRTGPVRQNSGRTIRRPRPGYRACPAGHGAGRARHRPGPRRPAASRPPRPATRPSPTPTTSRSCTRSGPPRPPRPASSATATC